MTHITCRLTAKNRNQLLNPTLGDRVWATFFYLMCYCLISPRFFQVNWDMFSCFLLGYTLPSSRVKSTKQPRIYCDSCHCLHVIRGLVCMSDTSAVCPILYSLLNVPLFFRFLLFIFFL